MKCSKLRKVLQTPWWVTSLWTAPQHFNRRPYSSTITTMMDSCMTGHWPVQYWTAKHMLKSYWTSARNLAAQERQLCNFCGLPPPHWFGKAWFSWVRSMYFLDLSCVYPFSNTDSVYSQNYIANVNNNYAFVLRTTTVKKSRQMGRRGRVHRKSIFIRVRSAGCSQSVFPGCLLKSHNCLQNLCFLKMHLGKKKKKKKITSHCLYSVSTDQMMVFKHYWTRWPVIIQYWPVSSILNLISDKHFTWKTVFKKFFK